MGIFDTDIKKLYGVGAARASHYASLGIHSVGDLLCHYPRGYEDRGNVKLLIDADGETKCAHLLTVATEPKSVRVKGRMSLTKFRVYDDSASCEITFFNQDYLKSVFALGSTFRFYGKVEKRSGRYAMTSPAYEPYIEGKELLPLVPVYPLTEGITQKQISKDVSAAMTLAATMGEADTLPEDIRQRNKLCTLSYAMRNIHMPESADDFALREAINSFLRSLDADTRIIFVRRYWYDSAISEIAADYSLPVGTVKSTLSRTRKRFREYLQKEGIYI